MGVWESRAPDHKASSTNGTPIVPPAWWRRWVERRGLSKLLLLSLGRFSIRVRLLGAFLPVLLLTGALAVVALSRLADLASTTAYLAELEVPEVHVISRMRSLVIGLETDLLHLLMRHDDGEDRRARLSRADEAIEKAMANHVEIHKGALPEMERRLMDELGGQYARLRGETARLLALIERGQIAQASAAVIGEWRGPFKAFLESTERLLAFETAKLDAYTKMAASQAQAGQRRVAALALLSIPLSLVLALVITRSITSPVRKLIQTTERASRGDLSLRARLPNGDEIGLLGQRIDEMMEALDQMLEQQRLFLAEVSHELGPPLTIITGEAEVALRGGDKPAASYRESLQIIAAQAGLMARQVDDLLFLARSRAGQVPYEKQDVELRLLLEAVGSQCRALAAARAVHLKVDLHRPVTVWGDPARLGELFTNLLDNAMKYTLPGGEVRIGLDEADGWARVVVADTGVGISARDLPHIFDRFYRGEARGGRAVEGAGLGLAIGRAIVQAHRGQISVESEEGRGSRFTVLLRLAGG
jgi:signal transduction histidine kinase